MFLACVVLIYNFRIFQINMHNHACLFSQEIRRKKTVSLSPEKIWCCYQKNIGTMAKVSVFLAPKIDGKKIFSQSKLNNLAN